MTKDEATALVIEKALEVLHLAEHCRLHEIRIFPDHPAFDDLSDAFDALDAASA